MSKVLEISLGEVEVHELAELTPTMTEENYEALRNSLEENGQEIPVIMYRGKVIDGRHRVKALRELGVETVKYENELSTLSIDDVRNKILNVYECRRHQTPTQKAIMAYREYLRLKSIGEKVAQGEVAKMFGTALKQVGRVKQLESLAGTEIVELLFQGNKINIGTEHSPNNTDSLYSLINYFKKHTELIVQQTSKSTVSDNFTDDEIASLKDVVEKLEYEYSHRMLEQLSKMLFVKLKGE